MWSSIEKLTNAVVDLSKAAKDVALNPNDEEANEVLTFAIEQARLLSEQSINNIVRQKKTKYSHIINYQGQNFDLIFYIICPVLSKIANGIKNQPLKINILYLYLV